MGDIQDDDGVSVLIDPVANAPARSGAGGILPGILILKRMADAMRILQQRAGEELGRRGSDLLRQPRELTLSARPDVEILASGTLGHAAPASWNRWAKRCIGLRALDALPTSPSGPFSTAAWTAADLSLRIQSEATSDWLTFWLPRGHFKIAMIA